LTRRRHGLPPPPLRWFLNLVTCFGNQLTGRIARLDERPIAGIVTLRHKKTTVYKYGGSDGRYHNGGAMPVLVWQTIQAAKSDRLEELDLGRSDDHQEGLIRFKEHLGARRSMIQYARFSTKPCDTTRGLNTALNSPLIKSAISHFPGPLFRLVGEMF